MRKEQAQKKSQFKVNERAGRPTGVRLASEEEKRRQREKRSKNITNEFNLRKR